MVRIMGAVLLVAGAGAWGISGVFGMNRRVRNLRSIISALSMMQSEICDRLTPVPELLDYMSKQTQEPLNILFKNVRSGLGSLGETSFAHIWKQGVISVPELMLNKSEEEALCELGLTLGKYDIGHQRTAIEYTRQRFVEFAKEAEAARMRDAKLQACLGVAAGLFAVIVLL